MCTDRTRTADLFSLQLSLQALHFCIGLLTICLLLLASLQLLCMQLLYVMCAIIVDCMSVPRQSGMLHVLPHRILSHSDCELVHNGLQRSDGYG